MKKVKAPKTIWMLANVNGDTWFFETRDEAREFGRGGVVRCHEPVKYVLDRPDLMVAASDLYKALVGAIEDARNSCMPVDALDVARKYSWVHWEKTGMK